MIRKTLLSVALLAMASPALAQSDDAGDKWSGFYVGASIGNTDPRGSREYNLALGQRRAEAVRRALGSLGVSDAQVEAVSLGEEKPRCVEASENCYAENRRADILYSGEF